MRTLESIDVRERTVLVRADFNVPLSDTGVIQDDTRIRAAIPTLTRLFELGASKLVLASHLGRPKGQFNAKYSMALVVDRVSDLLGRPVQLLPLDLEQARQVIQSGREGSVFLLENTRFYPGEEKNDIQFAHQLASLADAYVNDAFGSAHRAHASTEAIAKLLPSAAGLLMEKEVEVLTKILNSPNRPFVAILGGAKVSDKLGVISNLLPRVDKVLIGGAMANTFLLAQGLKVGKSLAEADMIDTAQQLLSEQKIDLPVDVVVASSLQDPDSKEIVEVNLVPEDKSIYDIGPKTIENYSSVIATASTVFWNGPMGVFETEGFADGTYAIARAVANCSGFTVVGGGDSVSALENSGMSSSVDHVSTGGGASLEFLEGKKLPGIAALEDNNA